MKESKKWINVSICIVSIYLLFSGNRGLWNLYKLNQEKNSLSKQVLILKNQIDNFQVEYKYFSKSSSAFEKQAREDLNLVKPGELVYKFAKKDGQY